MAKLLQLVNFSLLAPYLLCVVISLLMLGSISPDRLWSQALFFGLGIFLFTYLSSLNYSIYQFLAPRAYHLAIVLLLVTFAVGEVVRGSTRWIPLGSFNLQTSELAKPLLIMSFAYYLEKYPPQTMINILKNLLLFALPFTIIFFQPDLGTALVILAIFLVQLFLAQIPWRYVFVGLLIAFGLARFAPLYLHDYQLSRLESFIDPYHDPLGAGYNVIQSNIAIGSGGIFGKGLGHGTQSHLRFLPERHTDFMFASLSEELGGVGALTVLGSLVFIMSRLLRLMLTENLNSRLVAGGIFGYLLFQTFINIGMNLGIAPVTGVTLPLVSYGGSSILGVSLTLGLAGSLLGKLARPASLEIR